MCRSHLTTTALLLLVLCAMAHVVSARWFKGWSMLDDDPFFADDIDSKKGTKLSKQTTSTNKRPTDSGKDAQEPPPPPAVDSSNNEAPPNNNDSKTKHQSKKQQQEQTKKQNQEPCYREGKPYKPGDKWNDMECCSNPPGMWGYSLFGEERSRYVTCRDR